MTRCHLIIDESLCVGCHTCEVACKQENRLSNGMSWIKVYKNGPYYVGKRLMMHFKITVCKHCTLPSCARVCPRGAIIKRSNGVVVIDNDLCIGCKLCIEACPEKVIQYNPTTNTVEKCTLCIERIEAGLEPSCVKHCPTKAIKFIKY